MNSDVPRGRYYEGIAGDIFEDRSMAIRCPLCGGRYDCNDADQVALHFGALPHAPEADAPTVAPPSSGDATLLRRFSSL